jgi:hypothetical protein
MNPVSIVLAGAKEIIGGLLNGKLKKEEAESQLALLEATATIELLKGQQEINKLEAQSTDLFRGGWRPFIGWVCGAAMCYQFIVRPILPWAATWAGATVPPMPGLEDVLWELLFGMLGLGGFRTFERIKGKG